MAEKKDSSDSSPGISRRDFARRAVLVAATTAVIPSNLLVRPDRAVIAAAQRLQQLTDWHTKRPPIP